LKKNLKDIFCCNKIKIQKLKKKLSGVIYNQLEKYQKIHHIKMR